MTTGGLVFLGGGFSGAGTTTVTGNASFSGSSVKTIAADHTLNLNGDTNWDADAGDIALGTGSKIIIGAGTSFNDGGTAPSIEGKYLAYSSTSGLTNNGTYNRNGLGTTYAYGFNNVGTLNVNDGKFTVQNGFNNSGTVDIDAGAELKANLTGFSNAGLLQGNGSVSTYGDNYALLNQGHILPGSNGGAGHLSINGYLNLAAASILDIDLASTASFDSLSISSDLTVGGVLSVHLLPGYLAQVGNSFLIARLAQRVGSTTFAGLNLNGANGVQFEVLYHANDITLQLVAVPEPASWALLLDGLGLIGFARRNKLDA